jgi:hypothetical protein
MSIETVDTRDRAAAAVALVRQRAPETRFLPIAARPVPDHPGYFQVDRVDRAALPGGWTFLVDLTKRTVVAATAALAGCRFRSASRGWPISKPADLRPQTTRTNNKGT